mgnify:CR=1 FL=1
MYIYRTQGICPPEIHFQLKGNVLTGVRFVGGGCRGNAQLITRLLEGCKVDDVFPFLEGIICRNGTSCPDQLARAIKLAQNGSLHAADEIRVYQAQASHTKVAVIAGVGGRIDVLRAALFYLRPRVDVLYILGDLTGPGGENDAVVELIRKEKLIFAAGPYDRTLPCAKAENQDYLLQAPLFLSFFLGEKKAVGFAGGFIQELEGFSDFSRFSLELLMVCNLSDYLRKEEVYPALASMTQQFSADIVVFTGSGEWKKLHLGEVDFVGIGHLAGSGQSLKYAFLGWENSNIKISFEEFTPE